MEHLDCDFALLRWSEVLGEVDGGHAATADLPVDLVTVRQRFGEEILEGRHDRGEHRVDRRILKSPTGADRSLVRLQELRIGQTPHVLHGHDDKPGLYPLACV